MKFTHEVELQPFRVPGFVFTVSGPRKREDGFTEAPKYALSELDAETLDELCTQFRNDVFRKAGKSEYVTRGA